MNFAFSEEQEELRKSVRRFLDDKSKSEDVRRLMETDEGYDKAVWDQMAQQLGLQGLAIPEEYGGSGYTYVELGSRVTTRPRRTSSPASPRARPSPPWPSPRRTAAGTRAASR